jgi:hypothetical protein
MIYPGTKYMCCGQVAQGFGLLLGAWSMNPKTAQTIATIVMLAFVLVGGYFVRGALPLPTGNVVKLGPVIALKSCSIIPLKSFRRHMALCRGV